MRMGFLGQEFGWSKEQGRFSPRSSLYDDTRPVALTGRLQAGL